MGAKCKYVSVIEIAQYICREIQINSSSTPVREIKQLLFSYSRTKKEVQGALSLMSLIGKALVLSNPRFPMLASASISDKAEGRLKAYSKWKGLVAARRIWDHKKDIPSKQRGEMWSCDKEKHFLFHFDIWSNIHYGFIGKLIGFSEWELTSGAGVAQLKDNQKSFETWTTQYFQNRGREFGDADFVAAFDDAIDNEAIKIGFRLYDRFGISPSSLTPQDIIDEIYRSHHNHRPINIRPCNSIH